MVDRCSQYKTRIFGCQVHKDWACTFSVYLHSIMDIFFTANTHVFDMSFLLIYRSASQFSPQWQLYTVFPLNIPLLFFSFSLSFITLNKKKNLVNQTSCWQLIARFRLHRWCFGGIKSNNVEKSTKVERARITDFPFTWGINNLKMHKTHKNVNKQKFNYELSISEHLRIKSQICKKLLTNW